MNNHKNPRFGFVDFAEIWNGRLAILGVLIILITEYITGEGTISDFAKSNHFYRMNYVDDYALET